MGGPICNQEIEIAKCICIAELACSIYDTTKSIRFREKSIANRQWFIGSHQKSCGAMAKHSYLLPSHICHYTVIIVGKGELTATSKENLVIIVDLRAGEVNVLWMLSNLHYWLE